LWLCARQANRSQHAKGSNVKKQKDESNDHRGTFVRSVTVLDGRAKNFRTKAQRHKERQGQGSVVSLQNGRRVFGVERSVDQAFDPILDLSFTKVDQKTQFAIGEPQIGQHLFRVDRRKSFEGFQLNQDFVGDDEVGTKALFEEEAFVADGNWDLALDVEAALSHFVSKDDFVNGLEEPGSKLLVNVECGVDDVAGELVFVGHRASFQHFAEQHNSFVSWCLCARPLNRGSRKGGLNQGRPSTGSNSYPGRFVRFALVRGGKVKNFRTKTLRHKERQSEGVPRARSFASRSRDVLGNVAGSPADASSKSSGSRPALAASAAVQKKPSLRFSTRELPRR
jgi:hypothetical protein